MELTSGHRLQTFAKIRIHNINITNTSVEIKILDKLKTSNITKAQPILIFPDFSNKPELCISNTIKYYLTYTRRTRSSMDDNLILTHKRSFRAASSQTISRWIKQVLNESGIDTERFSGYNVRHASTLAALRGGLHIETIRKSAGWTDKSNIFTQFYNRLRQIKENFAEVVFKGSNVRVNNQNQ
ncbi:hypothetical protein RN001_007281 [Aquatica leii]|uniref:Tyr recombinase domain-containing protein n=1 Tax=Aquatica leii TaxID=1421715 RepID=A0AAN7SQV3_9COLE|nr:hypothetical protein RN001_007281 [Aquatica leii]